jgi:nucleotide-binding universal stress UspA family protein
MALKDILVHIDDAGHCRARLDAAIALAAAHDAHLIGLYVLTRPKVPGHIQAQIPEHVLRQQAELAEQGAAAANALFDERTKRAGIAAEWRCEEGLPVSVVALHGRYADIVIAGQRDPTGEEGVDDPTMPHQLVLSVGRPVLVVPHGGEFPVIGERVLVAWDASRLATRAVNDALPLLTRAKEVVVMAINPRRDETAHGEIPSADICRHLARHGIRADAQHYHADDIGIGALLLSRAADQGIDLIVCGAYGHARWRELVLGGVTRHLLTHMTVPVLMSH